jgi:protein phosphatase
MRIRPGVELASLSDVGRRRERNEDSYGYWESEDDAIFSRLGRFAVVADGMGGHEGGQVASRLAVEALNESYSHSTDIDPQKALVHAFFEAHQRIQSRAEEVSRLHGMGTTCTAFALVNTKLYFAHVGDSRLYLLRDRNLQLLSHDHTLIARWLESGVIRPEEAENHPQKHVLTAALGVPEDVHPDVPSGPISVQTGDIAMICTDGLWGQISEVEILQILGMQSTETACREFVKLANERGGPDNITVLIMRISENQRSRMA